jgi:formamidopyrimidine-DNA glycosylase
MPELPEVEVTRRRLEPHWVGARIERVAAGAPSYFFLTAPGTLAKKLAGRTAVSLGRHGKHLIAELDDGSRLLCHLGMTGQMFVAPENEADALVDEHVHLRLTLSAKGRAKRDVLVFRDVRKFGKVEWLAAGASAGRLERMGPDALAIDAAALEAALSSRAIPIKSALLDQTILAGVGNIYADEALYLAGIAPRRPARRVTPAECKALVKTLRRVLDAAIALGGSTISDFRHPDGGIGGYQQNHRVYGREGEPCPRCKTPITRMVIAQRSTHFCARCQD